MHAHSACGPRHHSGHTQFCAACGTQGRGIPICQLNTDNSTYSLTVPALATPKADQTPGTLLPCMLIHCTTRRTDSVRALVLRVTRPLAVAAHLALVRFGKEVREVRLGVVPVSHDALVQVRRSHRRIKVAGYSPSCCYRRPCERRPAGRSRPPPRPPSPRPRRAHCREGAARRCWPRARRRPR